MTSPQLPTELHGNVLVAGAGISGAGSARMLVDLGASVTVADDDETARLRVSEITGADNTSVTDVDLSRYSCVVTSPGWRPTTPLLVDAANQGIPVIGDVELCWRLDRSGVFGPPRTWLAVTGTNGKTTTTAMLAAMMNTVPVGNIGVAVSDALTSGNDILVVELSSFQLHWSSTIRPAAGCLLNLADDHIDWHGSFDNYRADKAKVLLGDVAVVGIDDPNLAGYDAIGFTLSAPARGQVGIVDGMIVDNALATTWSSRPQRVFPPQDRRVSWTPWPQLPWRGRRALSHIRSRKPLPPSRCRGIAGRWCTAPGECPL